MPGGGPGFGATGRTLDAMSAVRPPLSPDAVSRPRRSADLRAAGVAPHELAGDLWTPVLRGVHAWLGVDVTAPLTRIHAVAELMPKEAVIGGWAALYLHGVTDLDGRAGPGGRTLLPVPVCTGPVGRMRRRAGVAIDRSTLLEEDVTVVRDIPVTTAVRSCVDIMRWHGAEEGVVAGDATARFGAAGTAAVHAYVLQHAGMKGVPRARLAASLLDSRAASCPESRFRVVWVLEAGLPMPRVNCALVDADGFLLGEADLFDPESAMVGEYDGSDHRELARHTADNAREEGFERSNVTVVRATAIDLWPRRPQLVRRLLAGHADGMARDRSRDGWSIRLPTS